MRLVHNFVVVDKAVSVFRETLFPMLGLILCKAKFQTFSSHSANHSFTRHFFSDCFVPGTLVVIKDALARSQRVNHFHLF